jgi:hypothetical protein
MIPGHKHRSQKLRQNVDYQLQCWFLPPILKFPTIPFIVPVMTKYLVSHFAASDRGIASFNQRDRRFKPAGTVRDS